MWNEIRKKNSKHSIYANALAFNLYLCSCIDSCIFSLYFASCAHCKGNIDSPHVHFTFWHSTVRAEDSALFLAATISGTRAAWPWKLQKAIVEFGTSEQWPDSPKFASIVESSLLKAMGIAHSCWLFDKWARLNKMMHCDPYARKANGYTMFTLQNEQKYQKRGNFIFGKEWKKHNGNHFVNLLYRRENMILEFRGVLKRKHTKNPVQGAMPIFNLDQKMFKIGKFHGWQIVKEKRKKKQC